MTDSAASPQSKPRRAASKKQRQGGVSTETENKLARAARSAQRLAQLSGVARDDSTLDMFPDDPTRATLESMNIDVRQGTLDGFELPEVVLQAVGALDDGASLDKATRRVPRAVKVDAPEPVNERLSGFDIEPAMPADGDIAVAPDTDTRASEPAIDNAVSAVGGEPAPTVDAAANDKPTASARDQSSPLTSAMAAATVARSVTALRQAAEAASAGTAATAGGKPQRFGATFTKATMASRDAASRATAADAGIPEQSTGEVSVQTRAAPEPSAASATATALASAELANAKQANEPSAAISASLDTHTPFAAPSREARRAEAAAAALRAEPELDRARATAFADTVDALYGVIADQRHAAIDHSRRMKWMSSIVVGALLVTVAIGVAQTLLLMRLTRETTAQQQRIEQMMQNQQAAMISLLDAHTAVAVAAANAVPAPSAATPAVSAPASPALVHGKHAAHVPHGHKAKASGPH